MAWLTITYTLFPTHASAVYFEDIVKSKENYSDEQKAEDKEHMADLFRRAGSNADTEVTFRKVLESGEKIRL